MACRLSPHLSLVGTARRAHTVGVLLAAGLALAAPSAQAWGDQGHQVVATLAYARLTPAAKKAVDALLVSDKDTLTARDFVSRATWADRWRDQDRMTTHQHYNATRQWHFVDIEIDNGTLDEACHQHPPLPDGTAASAGPARQCVVDKLDQFIAELQSKTTPKAERLLALKYLIHFVGDVHQPLHAADHDDGGGNGVPVSWGATVHATNLHSYWDSHLVALLGKDAATVAALLAKSITVARAKSWSQGAPADWAEEAHGLAKSVAYNFSGESTASDDHGGTSQKLDAVYEARALPVVRSQLSKAGVRLAMLLNAAFK
ncbi:MAG: S1/P1 Nuclease [Burkholderiales bacterium PBB5]|nr:MAG: S1/P1 Nuclease [Burkholderiales bacterium PBB5]